MPVYYLLILFSTLIMMMKLAALKSAPPTAAIAENIRFVELYINSVVHDALFVSNIFKGGVPHYRSSCSFTSFFRPWRISSIFKKGPATIIALLTVSYIAITCARLALAEAGTGFNTDYFRFDAVIIGIFLFEAFSLHGESLTRLRGWSGNGSNTNENRRLTRTATLVIIKVETQTVPKHYASSFRSIRTVESRAIQSRLFIGILICFLSIPEKIFPLNNGHARGTKLLLDGIQ
ncbi:MAG: hypothetical protein JW838_07890 [Spirochaetes bacterium]|nr:hypothetical protein [Spirochaetota bacterium]